jgi:hypothetical protein
MVVEYRVRAEAFPAHHIVTYRHSYTLGIALGIVVLAYLFLVGDPTADNI